MTFHSSFKLLYYLRCDIDNLQICDFVAFVYFRLQGHCCALFRYKYLQESQPWRNGGGGGAEDYRGEGGVRLLRVSAAVGPD